jgi:hypothetical protein
MAYEGVIRWLGEQGATRVERLHRGRSRHPRLRFDWRGEAWVVVISGSPCTEWKAERAAITELRHLMGLVGGEKRVGERRARRHRAKFAEFRAFGISARRGRCGSATSGREHRARMAYHPRGDRRCWSSTCS